MENPIKLLVNLFFIFLFIVSKKERKLIGEAMGREEKNI